MSKQNALDIFSLVSLVHRKLDGVRPAGGQQPLPQNFNAKIKLSSQPEQPPQGHDQSGGRLGGNVTVASWLAAAHESAADSWCGKGRAVAVPQTGCWPTKNIQAEPPPRWPSAVLAKLLGCQQ